ncbi:unnamed protein product [Owenia fusiformis]|uniref:Uncharacterized protein n=1 Tax=Owenia fusiformis TaxID=6347 RepID=A0A8J1Y2Z9_OWEFU|nr:unnamed protein product [Owenia fusiformis]
MATPGGTTQTSNDEILQQILYAFPNADPAVALDIIESNKEQVQDGSVFGVIAEIYGVPTTRDEASTSINQTTNTSAVNNVVLRQCVNAVEQSTKDDAQGNTQIEETPGRTQYVANAPSHHDILKDITRSYFSQQHSLHGVDNVTFDFEEEQSIDDNVDFNHKDKDVTVINHDQMGGGKVEIEEDNIGTVSPARVTIDGGIREVYCKSSALETSEMRENESMDDTDTHNRCKLDKHSKPPLEDCKRDDDNGHTVGVADDDDIDTHDVVHYKDVSEFVTDSVESIHKSEQLVSETHHGNDNTSIVNANTMKLIDNAKFDNQECCINSLKVADKHLTRLVEHLESERNQTGLNDGRIIPDCNLTPAVKHDQKLVNNNTHDNITRAIDMSGDPRKSPVQNNTFDLDVTCLVEDTESEGADDEVDDARGRRVRGESSDVIPDTQLIPIEYDLNEIKNKNEAYKATEYSLDIDGTYDDNEEYDDDAEKFLLGETDSSDSEKGPNLNSGLHKLEVDNNQNSKMFSNNDSATINKVSSDTDGLIANDTDISGSNETILKYVEQYPMNGTLNLDVQKPSIERDEEDSDSDISESIICPTSSQKPPVKQMMKDPYDQPESDKHPDNSNNKVNDKSVSDIDNLSHDVSSCEAVVNATDHKTLINLGSGSGIQGAINPLETNFARTRTDHTPSQSQADCPSEYEKPQSYEYSEYSIDLNSSCDDENSNKGIASKDNENSYKGTASKDDENSYKGTASKDDENSHKGTASKDDENSYKGTASQDDENSYKGTASKDDENSYKGTDSKDDENSYKGTASKDDENSYKCTASKDDENSYKGTASQDDENSYKGTASKDDENSYKCTASKDDENSYKGTASQDDENSYKCTASKDDEYLHKGTVSKDDENSYKGTASQDDENSYKCTASKDDENSYKCTASKDDKKSYKCTASKDDEYLHKGTVSKEAGSTKLIEPSSSNRDVEGVAKHSLGAITRLDGDEDPVCQVNKSAPLTKSNQNDQKNEARTSCFNRIPISQNILATLKEQSKSNNLSYDKLNSMVLGKAGENNHSDQPNCKGPKKVSEASSTESRYPIVAPQRIVNTQMSIINYFGNGGITPSQLIQKCNNDQHKITDYFYKEPAGDAISCHKPCQSEIQLTSTTAGTKHQESILNKAFTKKDTKRPLVSYDVSSDSENNSKGGNDTTLASNRPMDTSSFVKDSKKYDCCTTNNQQQIATDVENMTENASDLELEGQTKRRHTCSRKRKVSWENTSSSEFEKPIGKNITKSKKRHRRKRKRNETFCPFALGFMPGQANRRSVPKSVASSETDHISTNPLNLACEEQHDKEFDEDMEEGVSRKDSSTGERTSNGSYLDIDGSDFGGGTCSYEVHVNNEYEIGKSDHNKDAPERINEGSDTDIFETSETRESNRFRTRTILKCYCSDSDDCDCNFLGPISLVIPNKDGACVNTVLPRQTKGIIKPPQLNPYVKIEDVDGDLDGARSIYMPSGSNASYSHHFQDDLDIEAEPDGSSDDSDCTVFDSKFRKESPKQDIGTGFDPNNRRRATRPCYQVQDSSSPTTDSDSDDETFSLDKMGLPALNNFKR